MMPRQGIALALLAAAFAACTVVDSLGNLTGGGNVADASDDINADASADPNMPILDGSIERGVTGSPDAPMDTPFEEALPDAPDAADAPDTADAFEEPDAPDECAGALVLVYRFWNATTNEYSYSTNASPPPGFALQTGAFRLPPSGTTLPTEALYVLYSSQAVDYLVTTDPTEGAALGYGSPATLGPCFSQVTSGAKYLLRFSQPNPLRHMSTIDPSGAPSGFSPDGTMNSCYVCPP